MGSNQFVHCAKHDKTGVTSDKNGHKSGGRRWAKTGGHGCEQLGTKNGSDCPKREIMTTFWGVTKKTNLRQTARASPRVALDKWPNQLAAGGRWKVGRRIIGLGGRYSNVLYLYGGQQ